jgi:hypothetical protein
VNTTSGEGFDDVLMARQIFCRGKSKSGENEAVGQAWEPFNQPRFFAVFARLSFLAEPQM